MSERPKGAEEVTAAWLNDVFHKNGLLQDNQVTDVTWQDLGVGVGIMCQVARISISYENPETTAPASVIGKFPTKDPTNLGVATSLFFYPREVAFYTQLAQHSPVSTPGLVHAELDMSDHGFVLLIEDLVNATAGDQVAGTTPEQSEAAMIAIGKLHGAWWDKVDGDEMAALFEFANPEFCQAVQAGYEGFLEPALTQNSDCFSDYTKQVARDFAPKSAKILETFSRRRRTFCHGDYRADNLMFQDGSLHLLDWQISGKGNGLYDVAYLVCNSMPQDYRRSKEQDLLHLYHDTLCEMGVSGYSFEDCWEDYRGGVLLGLFVAIYTCGGMDLGNERGVELARKIATRVDAAVSELQVGDLL